MGLTCALEIRSSSSLGVHLWFPRVEAIPAFQTALSLKRTLWLRVSNQVYAVCSEGGNF